MSTDWGELRRVVEQRFQAQWNGRTPIKWDNVPFTEPPGTPWVAVHILDGESMQASLETSPLYRDVGLVIVQVFTRQDGGTQEGRRLASFVAAAFRGWTAAVGSGGWLIMRAPSIVRVGHAEGWLQYNVQCRYRFDRRPWAA